MSKHSGCNGHEEYDVLVKNDDGTAALYIEAGTICDYNECAALDHDDYELETINWLNAVDPTGETDVNNINVSVRHNGQMWVAV